MTSLRNEFMKPLHLQFPSRMRPCIVLQRTARLAVSTQTDPWSQMSLKALRIECKKKGLKVSGKKAEVLKRLMEAITKNIVEAKRPTKILNVNSSSSGSAGPQILSQVMNGRVRTTDQRPRVTQRTESNHKSNLNTSITTNGFPHPKHGTVQMRSLNQATIHKQTAKDDPESNTPIIEIRIETKSPAKTAKLPIQEVRQLASTVKDQIETISVRGPTKTITQTSTKKIISEKTNHSMSNMLISRNIEPSSDLQDKSVSQLCLRDKFFLLVFTSAVSIWWWEPQLSKYSSKLLKGYEYLQSLI
ncbi:AIM34 (YMR003W) [Zygosaccharomyces parabailii]|uniref:ZYBA0S04-04016g1_1 n=1 Tax=Zygosaccharomyces bailii (strain CLIB 213 / ATCC 58445 / CBS 680 / BCRC 21525 / NBRC 1098 / NCYC 1416 / NRRL Y-2227) TaxID=1333698 RepID=A0A8J2T7H2_ZYGB2|nr:AIM34 (YMR003W) [Zygosaccharomyces parabailii]CDF89424.1 ZYBA0S04-04016g1_1 [Zygosaccharomyces bailii CLIB 213]